MVARLRDRKLSVSLCVACAASAGVETNSKPGDLGQTAIKFSVVSTKEASHSRENSYKLNTPASPFSSEVTESQSI
jgi:hypothetical protein